MTSRANANAIPSALNARLALALALGNALALFVVPAFLLPHHWPWALALLFAAAATSNALWSLVHEAIHGVLLGAPRASRALGRLLAVVFGGSLDVFRVVHLMHHKFNRTELERVEVLPAGGSTWRARLTYYWNLLGGTYVTQLLGLLLLLVLPTSIARARVEAVDARTYAGKALRAMIAPRTLRAIRVDTLAVFVLYGAAFALYGSRWPLLAAALGVRAFLVSLFNYVYHYDTPLDDVLYARNLRLSRLGSKLLLHFNLHGVHHRHPSLPWTALPAAFERERASTFDASFTRATFAQLRGPLSIKRFNATGRREGGKDLDLGLDRQSKF